MPDKDPKQSEVNEPPSPERRQLIKQMSATGAGMAFSNMLSPASDEAEHPSLAPLPLIDMGSDKVPRRILGRTGAQVSIIGIGGFTLGTAESLDIATRIIHEAIDAGVNFMDNAWEYNEHRSEEWMGQAIQGQREKVFLMTKVCSHGRDGKEAMQQLEQSLKRLRTDHLDLWQIHEVIYYNEPELHFAEGGVVDAFTEARRQGKVRFIGFTGHKNPAIHLRMLELADQRNVKFDTVQMPLNCFDATFRSFEQQILPEVNRRGIAALGMKSLSGSGESVMQGAVRVDEALRYAMSLPVATTISGIDSLQVLRQNLKIARGFQPMEAGEMQELRTQSAAAAADGHLELYKTTKKYDADEGRRQHGYPSPKELPL